MTFLFVCGIIYNRLVWLIMSVLEIENLKFRYTENELFNNASVRIFDGEHVGIVGANGCGKTTFMNLIAHKLIPDEGNIIWDQNKSFSYLDQHLVVKDDTTIYEYLYNVYQELFEKENEMNDLYNSLADALEKDYDKILNKAYKIQEYLEEKGFYRVKSSIGNVINGLGIDVEENRKLKDLSGGQRAKVFLGKMLLEEKDVLLLDEPTNFLDVAHVEWLSKFLNSYKKEFIVISHNVEFLNSVCNVIVALENKKLTKYKGNYDAYVAQRTLNMEAYEKQYEKQQKEIKRTQEFIDKNIVRASTTKQAQSRRKQLEKMVKLEKPEKEKKVHFDFEFTKSFNVSALETKHLNIGYDYPILKNINLKFEFGQKYLIYGKNGVGKSTFLKTILGLIPSLGGNIKMAPYNNILYYAQEEKIPNITAVEYVREFYPKMEDTEIRTLLAKYAVTGDLTIKPMTQLSGGEVTKVRFALLSLTSSNLLILDEPTNHLDRSAKESLFKAIEKYPGTVILVSHEKEFYQKLKMKEIKFE